MRTNIHTGKMGEEAAVKFLQQQGFTLLARNWRYKRAEVDIIAENSASIVFIEVKTLHDISAIDHPELRVDEHKENMLADAAEEWLDQYPTEKELRFDIVAVNISPAKGITIRHFPDAFYPID
jgi:putative endonuclease